eukprot:9168186-Lingulodinium_polyedra.AAC.1
MFEDYSAIRGGLPSTDVEPSSEQLAAVKQLLDSGSPPYVDFSVFGPHGRRMVRRFMFVAYAYQPATGEWERQEFPGPADFQAWWKSWM